MIRWFLNHILFAGTMFFAAGAPAIGGATPAGGSPGGASPGGGTETGAGTGGAAIPEAGGDGGDAAVDTDIDGNFEVSDFGQDDIDEAVGSHEEFGPETYKTVKEALKANPEVFKEVKKGLSLVKRFREHFESPEAAGELLTDIQSLGGWDTIKQDMGETATFLSGFNAGDKDVVKRWLDDNGEGLAKNMPTILDKWRETDEAGWAHDAAQTFIATLNQAPVGGISALAALSQLSQIEGVKDSDAYKRLVSVIQNVDKLANTAPAKTVKGPDEGKLSQREQQIAQKEQNLQRQALGGKAAPMLNKEASNALQLVAGGRKLSEKAKGDLMGDIHREFARLMEKDVDGKQKRVRLLSAGQQDQWLKMVKSAASRTMPQAARNVWRKYAGISGISSQQKEQRKAEGQQRRESGGGGTGTPQLELLSDTIGKDGRSLVDSEAMRQKFGSKNAADDAFMFGLKEYGGARVWIHKNGKMYRR